MNTYIWCDSYYPAFEYDFVVAMANTLAEARKIAKMEVMESDESKESIGLKLKSIDEMTPTIIVPNSAMLISHANE